MLKTTENQGILCAEPQKAELRQRKPEEKELESANSETDQIFFPGLEFSSVRLSCGFPRFRIASCLFAARYPLPPTICSTLSLITDCLRYVILCGRR